MKRSRVIILSALTLLTLVVQPLFLFAPAPKVSALTEAEIKKQATLYAYQRAMGFCVQKLENTINLNETPGKWLGAIGDNSVVTVGLLTETTDGNLECQNLFPRAMSAFGYSSSDPQFFKDLGYTCTVTTCTKDRTATLTNIRKIKNLPTSRTDAMSYFEIRATFEKVCGPMQKVPDPPTAAQRAAAVKGQNDLIGIFEAAPSGSGIGSREAIYKYDSTKGAPSDGAYNRATSLMSDGNSALSATGPRCYMLAVDYRDLSKSYIGTANQQQQDFAKTEYLNALTVATCGTATQPTDPMLRQEWQTCKTRTVNAFNTCYSAFQNSGTSTAGGNMAGGGGSANGDVGQLASCVASKTGADQAKILAALQTAQTNVAANAASLASSSTSTSDNENDTCPLPPDASLRWAGCALFAIGSDAIQSLHDMIQQFLYVSISSTFSPNVQTVSERFRIIGVALIVIAGLVMVVSQGLGLEIVDAYTIRKVLPRLLVAMIGIVLAWPLMKIAVTLMNDLGLGLDSAISAISDTASGGEVGTGSNIGAGVISALVGGTALLSLGVMGLLSLVWTVALALFLGLIVLSIRQVVIILCVVTAPFAIAAYVLPGTQKIWGFWKNTFLTTLAMYPIIMAFLAAGRAASNIIGANNTSDLMNIMSVLLYFAPYFMLPFAFKMAGGLMSTVFSIANDKERGLFDRAKKFRQGQASKNWQGMRSGNRFKGKNFATRSLNRGLEYGTNIDKAGLNPRQMRSRMRTAVGANEHDMADKFMKEDADFQTISGDDAKLYAARATSRTEVENRLATFDNGRFGGDKNTRARTDAANQILRAQQGASAGTFQKARVRAMAATGTGYSTLTGAFNATEMLDDINDAYGNDRNGAGRALAEMRGALTNSGQIAGQAGFGTWAGALEGRFAKGEGRMSVQAAHNTVMDDAIVSAQPGHAIYGKPTSAAAMGAAHLRRIQSLADSMSTGRPMIEDGRDENNNPILRAARQDDLDAATAAAAGLLDAMGQASPNNASAFANELMGQVVRGSGQVRSTSRTRTLDDGSVQIINEGASVQAPDMTVREMIDDRMNNEQYRIRRRDWGSNALASANARAAAAAQNQGGMGDPLGGSPK